MQQQAIIEEVELGQESYPMCCIDRSENGHPEVSSGALVDEAFKAFIEHAQGLGRSWKTVEGYQASLGLFRRYLDERGAHDLAALTPQVMAGFQAWLYQARSRYRRPYTLESQINILNSVQVFGHFLAVTGRMLHDPAEAIQLPRRAKRLPGIFLSTVEMKKLLRQPDTGTVLGFRDRTMYEVLYATGLRVRELTGMRVQDLNLFQSAIFIQQSKHSKDRYVPFGAAAGRYLAEYLDHVRPHMVRLEGEELVFLGRCGDRLDVGGVEQKLRIYAGRAGIKKHLTIHVFRHTLATEMLRHGADLRQIQEMLGHKNLKTTQIYTHIVKGELKRVQAHCHPREQTDLPEGFVRYRGPDWTQEVEK
jgi:integrase/recombinase XerD